MSADNWTYCPKCSGKFVSERDRSIAAAKNSYGQVSAERYEQMMGDAVGLPEKSEEPTLREDYQIGIYSGEFEIDYSSSCKNCGFEFNYRHKEKVK